MDLVFIHLANKFFPIGSWVMEDFSKSSSMMGKLLVCTKWLKLLLIKGTSLKKTFIDQMKFSELSKNYLVIFKKVMMLVILQVQAFWENLIQGFSMHFIKEDFHFQWNKNQWSKKGFKILGLFKKVFQLILKLILTMAIFLILDSMQPHFMSIVWQKISNYYLKTQRN